MPKGNFLEFRESNRTEKLLESLKFFFKPFFKAFIWAGAIVAANPQNILSQSVSDKDPEWVNRYQWDDRTAARDFDPEKFLKNSLPADFEAGENPTAYELEEILRRNLGDDFPLSAKKIISKFQRELSGTSINPFLTPNFAEAIEAQGIQRSLQEILRKEKADKARKAKEGILRVQENGNVGLRVFEGFDEISPERMSQAVAEASSIADASVSLSPADAVLLQQELTKIAEQAIRITLTEVDDTKLKGISEMSPERRFLVHMDRDQFQDPPKFVHDGLKEMGRLDELDGMLHGELTSIDKTPIARMVLPHREEGFVLIDTSYTNQYSPHLLLLIARQLQRARSGQGRPVVLLLYSPKTRSTSASLRAEVLLRPTSFRNQATTTLTAAMMPPTKNEMAWAGLYTSYMIFFWYFTKVTAKWPEVPEAPSSMGDFLRFAGEMGHFVSKYSTGIESHIFYSALIGFCYSAYTYLIFDKNVPAWQQTLRHLAFISMPAGLWTLAQVNGWGMGELFLSAAGLAAIGHTFVNSVWNNVSRSFSHAVFAARDGHRVGMGEVPFFGFRFKKQQFFRELLTFPLLFTSKIAHLIKLQPDAWTIRDETGALISYSTPLLRDIPVAGEFLNQFSVGELSFYALPIGAFSVSLSYFLLKDDGVNYAEDRKKLWKDALVFLKAPVTIPYRAGRWACRGVIKAIGARLNEVPKSDERWIWPPMP